MRVRVNPLAVIRDGRLDFFRDGEFYGVELDGDLVERLAPFYSGDALRPKSLRMTADHDGLLADGILVPVEQVPELVAQFRPRCFCDEDLIYMVREATERGVEWWAAHDGVDVVTFFKDGSQSTAMVGPRFVNEANAPVDDKFTTGALMNSSGPYLPPSVLIRPARYRDLPRDRLADVVLDEVEQWGVLKKRWPLVIKPRVGSLGEHVFIVRDREQLTVTIERLRRSHSLKYEFLVQDYVAGPERRLLVIGDQVFMYQRRVGHVVGDGVRTLVELIQAEIEQRHRRYTELDYIRRYTQKEISESSEIEAVLEQSWIDPHRVPAPGERVAISDKANITVGGQAVILPPPNDRETRELLRLTRMLGADRLGFDLKGPLSNLGRRPCILEVNGRSRFYPHEEPDVGERQPVGAAMLDLMLTRSTSKKAMSALARRVGRAAPARLTSSRTASRQ